MNKAFEMIFERLEELQNNLLSQTEGDVNLQVGVVNGVMYSKKIVHEVAEEYNGGWIPCSERLPEDGTTVLVQDFEEYYEVSICETRNGVKGFSSGDWWTSANNYIAWQPLSEPYKEV